MKAVITADIVNSTKILDKDRKLLSEILDKIIQELQFVGMLRCEMYMGDSFQVLVEDYQYAIKIAILIRLGLIKSNLLGKAKLDARMVIGIGDVSYEDNKIILSDGEAFRLSGRAFDSLGKKRILLATNNIEVDRQLNLLLAFIDDILLHISISQSRCLYESLLLNLPQKDIAKKLGMTQPNVAKLLKASKEVLFREFLGYAEEELSKI